MRRRLPADAVIVEAGAHFGEDTVEFARMWPGGQIHAFEPIPAAYDKLRNAVGSCPNVTTYRCALGDTEGTLPMWLDERAPNYSSLLKPTETLEVWPGMEFEPTAVEVVTLETWAERAGIDRIDGMWLDMQGFELAALRAAGAVLATTRAIVLEISSRELYLDFGRFWVLMV